MRIRINLYQLCLNLDPEKRVPVEKAVAERFLRSLGLRKEAGWWVADSDSAINWLELNEIEFIKEQEDVGISDWSDDDRQAFVARFQQRLLERQHIDVGLPPEERGKYKIPRALVGRHRDVMRDFKKITRKAQKMGSWAMALEDVEMVPVEETPGEFVTMGPSLLVQGENILLYTIYECLRRVTGFTAAGSEQRRSMALAGLDHFWFCLGVLGEREICMIPSGAERRLAWEMLEKIMRWWPVYCLLDQKWTRPFGSNIWRSWYMLTSGLVITLGLSRDEWLNLSENSVPEEVGKEIRQFMRRIGGP